MDLTKAKFLEEYRKRLPEAYPWAAEPASLNRFMASVVNTLIEPHFDSLRNWNHDSPIARAIWKEHGGKAKSYSLKALRNLPYETTKQGATA